MQRNCYRCGHLIEEQIAFCPACSAPQIKVSRAPEQPFETQDPADLTPPPTPAEVAKSLATGFTPTGRIEWKPFIRSAAPLAALTGVLTALLTPLGLFIALPASSVWTISRYRRGRPAPIGSGQGARMGALMGLISFGFYAAFFLSPASQSEFHELIVNNLQQQALHAPDPQSQQLLQWLATPHGFIAVIAFTLAVILVIFLIIGIGSGAMAAALAKTPNRPGM
jgi:hypothetical protein